MDDPVNALVGALLIGTGYLLIFGAYRNRKLFGKDGMLASALTTGDLTSDAPEAFPDVGKVATKVATVVVNRERARVATLNIAVHDSVLAELIGKEIDKLDSAPDTTSLAPLKQLLHIVSARGLKADADIIRDYVKSVTDESI